MNKELKNNILEHKNGLIKDLMNTKYFLYSSENATIGCGSQADLLTFLAKILEKFYKNEILNDDILEEVIKMVKKEIKNEKRRPRKKNRDTRG